MSQGPDALRSVRLSATGQLLTVRAEMDTRRASWVMLESWQDGAGTSPLLRLRPLEAMELIGAFRRALQGLGVRA